MVRTLANKCRYCMLRVHVVSYGSWLAKEAYFFNFCHVVEYWPLSGWSNATSDFLVTMLVSQWLTTKNCHIKSACVDWAYPSK